MHCLRKMALDAALMKSYDLFWRAQGVIAFVIAVPLPASPHARRVLSSSRQ